MGREAGIEDEMARVLAAGLLPEGDESEDLLRLFPLPDVAVGVAEGSSPSILGQEDEDTGLPPAAGTLRMGPSEDPNRMTSSRLQAPPRPSI